MIFNIEKWTNEKKQKTEDLLNATTQEDIPLIMGTLSFIGVLSLVAHLVADITYAFLDPRIRYQ